ncbi:MAG TPA: class I SAM-dependent methyltransferase [Vicinamibacterales bacterium]|nr:class I SAM-dependent methyltransferase [Vicinamibacterales bacterium]
MTLQEQFGNIDIYVFDQLLRGRIASASAAAGRYGGTPPKLAENPLASEGGPGVRVFDAGCGNGRNLVYFLREGYDVFANDADANAIDQVRALAASLAPGRTFDFRVEPIEATSFPDGHADVLIANAVLHFARDAGHFESMLRQMWRVLKPGGVFFARLASTIGIESQVVALGHSRFRLPDGSDRFLIDAAAIEGWTRALGGTLIDPIKTTVVHDQRSMTTWVARK